MPRPGRINVTPEKDLYSRFSLSYHPKKARPLRIFSLRATLPVCGPVELRISYATLHSVHNTSI